MTHTIRVYKETHFRIREEHNKIYKTTKSLFLLRIKPILSKRHNLDVKFTYQMSLDFEKLNSHFRPSFKSSCTGSMKWCSSRWKIIPFKPSHIDTLALEFIFSWPITWPSRKQSAIDLSIGLDSVLSLLWIVIFASGWRRFSDGSNLTSP